MKASPTSVFVVAPYSPVGSCASPALGAAKKIAAVIGALSALGHDVILVNTAHNEIRYAPRDKSRLEISPGLVIEVITLSTLMSRPVGKAFNVMQARSIARQLSHRGAALLWIYNGYAFESRFALEFIKRTGCPLVVELEDMPFSRKRPGNIKPRLDDYYLQRVLPIAALVTCVNNFIPSALKLSPENTFLLPGLVDSELLAAGPGKQPFSGARFIAGYFGNLSAEKGADIILQLSRDPPSNWRFVVTGSGPMVDDFAEAAKKHPDQLKFIPNASGQEVVSNMLDCDAIINPHSPIANMGNGVFPFKVIEALASGRLVISTALPKCGIELEASVLFIDHGAPALSRGLAEAEHFYRLRQSEIESTSVEARSRFSQDSLTMQIKRRFFCNQPG